MKDGIPSLVGIIEGVKREDRKAQKLLYESYYSYAKTICLLYSSSEEDAVEILNDSFLNVFRHIELYDDTYSFKTWLRKIIVHKAIDYFRKYNKSKSVDLESVPLELLSQEDQAVFDNIEDLMPCIKKLSPMYRLVLNLHVLEDLSHEEIGKKLNISPGTSRSNLFRAIATIRKLLNPADHALAKIRI